MDNQEILNKIKIKLDKMNKDEFYRYLTESNIEVYKVENKETDTIFYRKENL